MFIKKAKSSDFKEFKRLFIDTVYSNEAGSTDNSTIMPYSREDFISFLEEGGIVKKAFRKSTNQFLVYLLIDNNVTIGYAILSLVPKRFLTINEFYIEKSLQFNGKGSFFYKEIEKIAKKEKVKQVRLYCPFPRAVIFWKKQGFLNNGLTLKKQL